MQIRLSLRSSLGKSLVSSDVRLYCIRNSCKAALELGTDFLIDCLKDCTRLGLGNDLLIDCLKDCTRRSAAPFVAECLKEIH